MIRKGQRVTIKPEFRDAGDEAVAFYAIEDEDGGRVRIVADLGWNINPQQVVLVSMLQEGKTK